MFTDTFTRIAEEAIIRNKLQDIGMTPLQKEVSLKISYHLTNIANSKKNEFVSRVMDKGDVKEVFDQIMMESLAEAFKITLEEFKNEGNWEAYGETSRIKGSMGL